MPGLSQYSSKTPYIVDAPDNDLDTFIDTKGEPGLAARMRQRYLDSLGFADLQRSAPDELSHGLMRSVPREYWDTPVNVLTPGELQEIVPDAWIMSGGKLSPEYTMRQLMEALGKLRPNEQQGP